MDCLCFIQSSSHNRIVTPLFIRCMNGETKFLYLCSLQDLLPELQTVCQCCEAVLLPVLPVVTPAELRTVPELEPQPEKTLEAKITGTKRKRTHEDSSAPPAKKILGDGTRSPSTPVSWKSNSSGIVIK